jgi:hypothetical protein
MDVKKPQPFTTGASHKCLLFADCAGGSGGLLPPSPPCEKAAARQDQGGQAGADSWAGGLASMLRVALPGSSSNPPIKASDVSKWSAKLGCRPPIQPMVPPIGKMALVEVYVVVGKGYMAQLCQLLFFGQTLSRCRRPSALMSTRPNHDRVRNSPNGHAWPLGPRS